MSASVFAEFKFWLLVLSSVIAPFGIYGALLAKRAISRWTVLAFGLGLVALAGADIWLLQNLSEAAKHTPSLADDSLFVSELSLALYLLPALFAGVGINMVSHVLVSHLVEAEARFEHGKKD
ncbi:MAG: hypothetical protein ACAH21_15270 [Ramlibacter sp.]|nr:hypothetical protein [Ramlibacter sp.]